MSFWSPDLSQLNNYYDRGKYKLAWRLSILFSIVFLILTLAFVQISLVPCLIYGTVFLISVGTLFFLSRTKRYTFVFWSYTVSASLILFFSFHYLPTLHYTDFIWTFSIILFAFIGLGRKIGMFFIGIHAANMVFYMLFSMNRHMEHIRIQTDLELISITFEMVFALFTMTYLLSEYLHLQQYAEHKLSEMNQELEIQNRLINLKSEENELLVKEIHHRVKNNLQIVISLLRMQMNDVELPETRQQLNDAINRVMTMSLIHQKLYQDNELASINPKRYFENLSKEILSIAGNDRDIRVTIDAQIQDVGLKTIVPLGLMINELLSNSLKHAFSDATKGEITIHLSRQNGNYLRFIYCDSGRWKEPSGQSNGFGSELLQMLTVQLEGKVSRIESCFTFELKNLDS